MQKGLLPRVILNLTARPPSRILILSTLLGVLRPDAEASVKDPLGGLAAPAAAIEEREATDVPIVAADGALSNQLYCCRPNVVYGRPQSPGGKRRGHEGRGVWGAPWSSRLGKGGFAKIVAEREGRRGRGGVGGMHCSKGPSQ